MFGVSDGLVSNVSLILGFAGGGATPSIVRLAGLAGAIAGGISMAAGEWISVSAQNELIERELEIERRELTHHPTAETEELAGMYEADGMDAGACPAGRSRRHAPPRDGPRCPRQGRARRRPGQPRLARRAPRCRRWCASCSARCSRCFRGCRRRQGTAPTVASVVIGVVAAAAVGAVIGRLADRSIVRSIAPSGADRPRRLRRHLRSSAKLVGISVVSRGAQRRGRGRRPRSASSPST